MKLYRKDIEKAIQKAGKTRAYKRGRAVVDRAVKRAARLRDMCVSVKWTYQRGAITAKTKMDNASSMA